MELGGTPPLNGKSVWKKEGFFLNGIGGYPPPLNGQNPLKRFWKVPLETLKFWWWRWLQGWRATCVLAIMMMVMMVKMMMVITSGLAGNVCTCRRPWLAPCSPPFPCRGAKEQWSQVFNFEHQVPWPLDAILHYQNQHKPTVQAPSNWRPLEKQVGGHNGRRTGEDNLQPAFKLILWPYHMINELDMINYVKLIQHYLKSGL